MKSRHIFANGKKEIMASYTQNNFNGYQDFDKLCYKSRITAHWSWTVILIK